MTAPSRSSLRTDVEVLRGIAVALVVAEHAVAWPVGGWLGVDVFFVLSGFVITRSLLDEHRRTGRIALVAFAARRIRRLLPAALLVVAVVTTASALVWYRPRAVSVLGDAVAAVTGTMNWHLLRQDADYFATAAPSPLRHFWSLAVEEQFYAVWPVVLVGLLALVARQRRAPRTLLALAASAVVLGVLAAAVSAGPLTGSAYFDTGARAWELLAGAAVAMVPPTVARTVTRRPWALLLRSAGAAAGVLGIASAPVSPVPTVPVVLGTAAVLLAGDLRRPPRAAVVLVRPWTALGRVSYAAYLWHWPLLVFATVLVPGPLGTAAAVLLTPLTAWLSTRYVEEPLRRPRPSSPRGRRARRQAPSGLDRGSRALRPLAAAPLAVPVIVVALSVSTMTVGDPASATRVLLADPDRGAAHAPFPDAAALRRAVTEGRAADGTELADAADRASLPRAMQDGGCLADPGAPIRVCGTTEDPDVLLVGDSTTVAWSPTVIGALPDGTSSAVVGVASCSAVIPHQAVAHRWSDTCRTAKQDLHRVVERVDPEVVVISAVTGEYREHLADLGHRRAAALWEESVSATISAFRRDGRAVVVLSAPQYGPDTASCPDRVRGFAPCVGPVTADARAKRAAEAAAVRAAGDGVAFVDGAEWFCDAGGRSCPAVVDDTLVRVDQVHTTLAFAERLVPVMRAALDWESLLQRRSSGP